MFGSKKKATASSTVAGVNVGRLTPAMDIGGFDVGVIVDDRHRQVTLQFAVGSRNVVPELMWQDWEERAGLLQRVIALFTTDVAGGNNQMEARAGAVFHAEEKQEKKDVEGFVSQLLVDAAPLFVHADDAGLESHPLDQQGVVDAAGRGLGVEARSWEDLAKIDVTERDADIDVEGSEYSVFIVPADMPGIADEIDEIMGEWEGAVPLRRTRIYRPLVIADAFVDDALAGGGRRHIIMTVGGGTDGARMFVSALSHTAQIAVRRCWCRQRSLLIAGLGLGALGFQRGPSEAKRPEAASA